MRKDQVFDLQLRNARDLLSKNEQYEGISESDKVKVITQRLNKFYNNGRIKISDQHFRPRMEPQYDETVHTADDTLVLFGTDFMNPLKLKKTFGQIDSQFSYIYLDKSNCMLKFSSAKLARKAIKTHIRQDSTTAFKIQEGATFPPPQTNINNISLSNEQSLPKKWIQLNPYQHRYIYNNISPNVYKDFTRRLFVRYATSKEKMMSKLSFSHIEQLLQRSTRIWTHEAQKNKELKSLIMEKLGQFRKKHEAAKMNNQRAFLKKKRNAGEKRRGEEMVEEKPERSRSRDFVDKKKRQAEVRRKKEIQKSFIDCDQIHPPLVESDNESLKSIIDDDRNELRQKQAQKQNIDDMHDLVKGLEVLNISFEQNSEAENSNGESISGVRQLLEDLNFDKYKTKFVSLPYKLAIPDQVRRTINKKEDFIYDKFCQKMEQDRTVFNNYYQIDLTED